jgi:hypothetical protein
VLRIAYETCKLLMSFLILFCFVLVLYIGSLNYSAVEIVINVQVVLDYFCYCVFYSLCFSSRLATKSDIVINMFTRCTKTVFVTVYFVVLVFAPVYGPKGC